MTMHGTHQCHQNGAETRGHTSFIPITSAP